jgi:hypothetical protein
VREDEFTARSGVVIGTEEQPGQGVGINVAFEPHRGSALNVQHDAVPVVEGSHDGLSGRFPGQFEDIAVIGLVQPRQTPPDIGCVKPTARDRTHACRLAGQDRRTRVFPEVGTCRRIGELLLPVIGKPAG